VQEVVEEVGSGAAVNVPDCPWTRVSEADDEDRSGSEADEEEVVVAATAVPMYAVSAEHGTSTVVTGMP
jgi:hypothetical protein